MRGLKREVDGALADTAIRTKTGWRADGLAAPDVDQLRFTLRMPMNIAGWGIVKRRLTA